MEELIHIETANAAAAINMVAESCLGSCSILGMVGEEQRMQILQACAERTQVICGGAKVGQNGPICGQQTNEAKSIMMQQVRAARV